MGARGRGPGRGVLLLKAAASSLLAAVPVAGADILERFIAPMDKEAFKKEVYEERWAYFPHNETVLPMTLDDVSEWFGGEVGKQADIEMLPHPATQAEYNPGKRSPLEKVQDAFLKGHSMVINSLHSWSEPGVVLARDLFEAIDLPVDVYMYLTPPHSKSYNLHNDVMDAWMVQVAGKKTWRVCEKRAFDLRALPREEGKKTGACETVVMQGGDVMYVPFLTLHLATTSDELSAHLTVNVERQYYVWATLLLALLHKLANPKLTVEAFLQDEHFRMEGETEIEQFLLSLMRRAPRLRRIPLGGQEPVQASRWLTRPLSGEDLPEGYLPAVIEDYRAVVAEAAAATEAGKWKRAEVELKEDSRPVACTELMGMLAAPEAQDALPWVLELVRVHVVKHFVKSGTSRARKLSPPAETFTSLAAMRSDPVVAKTLDGRGQMDDGIVPTAWLRRREDARALLLMDDFLSKPPDSRPKKIKLQVGASKIGVDAEFIEVVHYCLGLFGEKTAKGQPFQASSVPGGFESAKKVIKQLLAAGVLRVLPQPATA